MSERLKLLRAKTSGHDMCRAATLIAWTLICVVGWSAAASAESLEARQVDSLQGDRVDTVELQREYDAKKLQWRDGHAYDGDQRLEGAEFYYAIDEPELADQYRSYQPGLISGGIAIGLTGANMLLMPSIGIGPRDGFTRSLMMMYGLAASAAGVLMFFSGLSESHPISRDEREQAVDDHNDELRRDLGVPTSGEPSSTSRQFRPTTAVPSQDNGGGMPDTGGGATVGITIPF